MVKYKIKVPLTIEQKNNFPKHNISSSNSLKFNFKSKYIDHNYNLIGDGDKYYIIIENLNFESLDICAKFIEDFLNDLMPVCSLIIQNKHSNPHYSHIKLNYNIFKIIILEETPNLDIFKNQFNNNVRESLSMTSILCINFEKLDELFNIYQEDINFKYILNCYYRALSATDSYTKYYNAFTVIEFIETYFKQDISTNLLLEENTLKKIISDLDNNTLISNKHKDRIINRVMATLKSATLETRAQKLELIIKKIFKINEINMLSKNKKITVEYLTEIIKIRNTLFHGKKINEESKIRIFEKCLELIKLIEIMLLEWDQIEKLGE
jgi:hypothetical protein